jgi:hypothetical protein
MNHWRYLEVKGIRERKKSWETTYWSCSSHSHAYAEYDLLGCVTALSSRSLMMFLCKFSKPELDSTVLHLRRQCSQFITVPRCRQTADAQTSSKSWHEVPFPVDPGGHGPHRKYGGSSAGPHCTPVHQQHQSSEQQLSATSRHNWLSLKLCNDAISTAEFVASDMRVMNGQYARICNTPSSLPSSNAISQLQLQSPSHRNQPPTSNIKSSASSSA